jgi:aspartate racemase
VFCNTAHAKPIWDIICSETSKLSEIKLINIIDSTLNYLTDNSMYKIGLLSTLGTYKERIYESYVIDKSVDIFTPDKIYQEKVHDAIYNLEFGIKKLGHISEESHKLISEAIYNMVSQNHIDCIILGCTELSMVYGKKNLLEGIRLIDPTDIFISVIKENFMNLKRNYLFTDGL